MNHWSNFVITKAVLCMESVLLDVSLNVSSIARRLAQFAASEYFWVTWCFCHKTGSNSTAVKRTRFQILKGFH